MNVRLITLDLLSEFQAKLIDDEKSKYTIEKYLRDVRQFMVFSEQKNVDKALVVSYKAMLKDSYTVESANSMLASINAFFRFVGWLDIIVKQYRVQKKVFCEEEKELTREEYLRLVRAAEHQHNERLSLLLQTICSTGIRISELQYITVEAVRTGKAIVSCKNKTRSIFIVKKLQNLLISYCERNSIKTGQIFVTKTGNPINRSNVWREMKAVCKEAGVNPQKVFPHNLRHLFARVFYGIEKDLAKLADIMGHSNINTTRIYIIATGIEHKRKMENMKLLI
ncbi:MAG: tyrosine-type recombinase/integrase [Clostridia bacterium]|nr:tyrosine-type recombinase/integrase [Clostridia bacterium]